MEREYENLPERSCEKIKKLGGRSYQCLNKKNLTLLSRSKDGFLTFKLKDGFCEKCPFQKQCKLFGKKNPMILDDKDRKVMSNYLKKARSKPFEKSYRRRKVIVEPVFGNIKNKGIKIWVRGSRAVKTWWKIACSAHNIEKMIKKQISYSH